MLRHEKKTGNLKRRERMMGLLFISPLYVQFIVFVLFFVIYSLYMSFTNWNILAGTRSMVGFDNFRRLFSDSIFWKSVVNTVYLMISIPISMFLALLVAIALNRSLPGKNIFRIIIYLPAVSSSVAVALLWRWIYNAEFGVLNMLIESLLGLKGPNWLGDPGMVKISLIIMHIWGGLGGRMVLFLAGLSNMPKDYYEVVDVEGGNAFHKFRYVTLPMLSPVIFYMFITGVIGGLQAFGDQFIMTGVGPQHSAITIVYYLWQKAFVEHNMGYACAISWVLAISIFVITLVQFKNANRWVYNTEK